MKARKFIRRDRTTAGRATGTVTCRLLLPAIDEEHDWRTTPTNPARAVGLIRKFVVRHLPKNPDLLTDASFVIEAEIVPLKPGLVANGWQLGSLATPLLQHSRRLRKNGRCLNWKKMAASQFSKTV